MTDFDAATQNSDAAHPPEWPEQPAGLVIMGKRQGTKKENRQLWGRTALAAALWHSAPQPKPVVIFVASDIHGPQRTPDADAVKQMLIQKFEIPSDFVVTRKKTNCTLLEVRAVQAIRRAYGLEQIFAVTHLYHAARSQRYFDEVIAGAAVIPVHPDILAEIAFPTDLQNLLDEIQQLVAESMPGKLDNLREYLVERFLGWAHAADPRGRFERRLAKVLRPGAYS
ncbi:MAG: hypothetical protein D6768_09055 [Chloroflexi bacterium]|nr:MAG: hypothetical protein D6768_09055 [Chloroflexota bacterium]